MFTVYAISSLRSNYIYVGFTKDLKDRVRRHNHGYEKTTRPFAPFDLLYSEETETREIARKREKYWKSGEGKEKLRKLRDNLGDISDNK